MATLVDSRDVLDPDAMTRRAFRGRILGHWRRTGPDSWDPYRYQSGEEGEIEVLPRLKVQRERHGARMRLRKEGRVVRVEWIPAPGDLDILGKDPSPREVRGHFFENYLEVFDEEKGKGVAPVLASKLIR